MNEAAAKKIYMALWEGHVTAIKPGKRGRRPRLGAWLLKLCLRQNFVLLGAVSRQNLERESDNEEAHEMYSVASLHRKSTSFGDADAQGGALTIGR